jgi:ribonuclease HI
MCNNAEEAEARGTLLGLKLIHSTPHQKVILELDNSTVVAALNSKLEDRSTSWDIYIEAKSLLNNQVANALAKLARSSGDHYVSYDIPIQIRELVM